MPGYTYKPSSMSGWIWNRTRAVESLGRAYNYPHQTAVYHSMYRLAADYDLVPSQRPAVWYLQQAAATIKVPFRLIRPRSKILQSYHPSRHVERFQQLAWLNAIFCILISIPFVRCHDLHGWCLLSSEVGWAALILNGQVVSTGHQVGGQMVHTVWVDGGHSVQRSPV